jgi:hypothetical protein
MFKASAKGSVRHLPKRTTKTQKSQPPGIPRGWQMGCGSDRISEIASLVRRSAQRGAAVLRDILHTAATGHAYTRGEDVILCLLCAR